MPETCEGKDMTELDIGRYTESDDDAGDPALMFPS